MQATPQQWELRGWRRAALLAAGVVVVAFYLYWAGRDFLASYHAAQAQPESLARAAALQPNNSEHHRMLGRYLLFGAGDIQEAIASLRRASELEPYRSAIWFDLATAYLVADDSANNIAATERGIRANPTNPEVAWQASLFYVVQNRPQEALPYLKTVVEHDPASAGRAFELAWRAFASPEQLAETLPPIADRHLRLLRFLMEKQQKAGADLVWDRLAALGQPFSLEDALRYVDFQLQQGDVDRAVEVWNRQVETRSGLAAYQEAGNLVLDPGFELRPLSGGFGWRLTTVEGVKTQIDSSDYRGGLRSLSVQFEGKASQNAGVQQYIAVAPDREYELVAQVKAGNLVSASGPRLVARDAHTRQLLFAGSEFRGTTPWQEFRARFRTGPETRLLALRIERHPGSSLIKGSLHVDNVVLREAAGTGLTP